jgi:hypothetical protein
MAIKLTQSILEPRREMEAPTTLGRIKAAAADFQLLTLTGNRLVEGRSLAERLINPNIASVETMQWVQEKTGLGLMGLTQAALEQGSDPDNQSPIVGLLGIVPLTHEGNQAVLKDGFNAVDPAFEHVCNHDEEPEALFGWGIAVSRHEAARSIFHIWGLIRERIVPNLDWYARAVTDDGARFLIERMGWLHLEGSNLDTLWYPSIEKAQTAQATAEAAV